MSDALAPGHRYQYKHEGRLVYEWDQTVAEVNVYTPLPPGIRARDLCVTIKSSNLSFGLKGNPPFLDHDLSRSCKASESLWTVEDAELHVTLIKGTPGEAWPSPFKAHAGEPQSAAQEEADRRRLMLERFQLENPGFDFSNADFSGQVPDPATFLGGVKGR